MDDLALDAFTDQLSPDRILLAAIELVRTDPDRGLTRTDGTPAVEWAGILLTDKVLSIFFHHVELGDGQDAPASLVIVDIEAGQDPRQVLAERIAGYQADGWARAEVTE